MAATREQVFVEVAAVLLKEGVLKESLTAKAIAAVTGGSAYSMNPKLITDDTVSKVVGALEKIDPANYLKNAKDVGLHSLMQMGKSGQEHPRVQELKNALEDIATVASGKGVADMVQERVAAARAKTETVIARTQEDIARDKARVVADAENRSEKGGSIRSKIIAQGSDGNKGCTPDDVPDHGLGGMRAKPAGKGQSCTR